jgi:hypothetical protein
LQAPQRPGSKAGTLAALCCTLIHVAEEASKSRHKPLSWWLLTEAEVSSRDEVLACVEQYASRWVIEDYHKAIKTGMGAERLQMERAHQLFAAISLMAVVALRLVYLREQSRVAGTRPVEQSGLSPLELAVLSRVTKKSLNCVRDVARAVGALGGHLGRRADGEPGWQTLWYGMTRLLDLVEGARLGADLMAYG